MPSDTGRDITGRCYCGRSSLSARVPPSTVCYCHCTDCKRVTGSPLPAFAAFPEDEINLTLPSDMPVSHNPGVARWFCTACGSQMGARFDYLPGMIYVPLGVIDQAADLTPRLHSHSDQAFDWLCMTDGLPRDAQSARERLNAIR